MADHLIGQACALLAAVTWASALVLFKRSGERISPIALNLYKNTIGLLLLLVTLAVAIVSGKSSLHVLTSHAHGDICILLLSGMIGIALADTVFFHALNLIGVGLISIADCAYAPLTVTFAWLMLAEKLTFFHYAGGALIIVGVFVASRHKVPANRTRGQIVGGMLLAVVAVGMMAFGIVLAKPVLADVGVLAATTVRMVAGQLLLSLLALLGRGWRQNWMVFHPSRTWKVALPGSVLGAYLAMLFWVAGFTYTYASVAAVLNQMSVIFAAVFAAVFLKEQFGGRKIAALVLAVIGVTIVTLSDWLGKLWVAAGVL